MAKTLKEALLEQMAALQERGLAPGEIPEEQEEEPSYYAQFEDDGDRRMQGFERDREPRRRTGLAAAGRPQRIRGRTSGTPRREGRGVETREVRGKGDRREGRDAREAREALVEMPAAPPARPLPAPRPVGPPMGPRPMVGGPRPAPRADLLRRNAERLQREQADRNQIRQLLTTFKGEEADDASVEKFFSQLAVETGALPPLNVVLNALQSAGNANPGEVGNQVRLHYRRARSRPAAPAGVS